MPRTRWRRSPHRCRLALQRHRDRRAPARSETPRNQPASGEGVSVLPATGIEPARELEDVVAVAVECLQHGGLVRAQFGAEGGEYRAVDLEGDLTRTVVAPKTHAMPGWIVTPAGIGKIKCHVPILVRFAPLRTV